LKQIGEIVDQELSEQGLLSHHLYFLVTSNVKLVYISLLIAYVLFIIFSREDFFFPPQNPFIFLCNFILLA